MNTTGATSQDEIITGPKDGDSLADDLDNRREVTGDMLLGGHPNDEPEEAPGGGPEAKPEEEAKSGEEEVKPGEVAPKKEEPPAGPRFKSQDEAEKAHAEAERTMTQAKMEAAEERKTREKLEREIEELRQAQAKPPEEEPEEKPVVKPLTNDERMAKITEATAAANRAAMPKLRTLDPDDPDYEEKYAAIMTEISGATAKALLEVGITAGSMNKEEVIQLYREQREAEKVAEKAAREKEDRQTAAERAWQQAVSFGVDAGLSLKDEESADHDLFMVAESKLPEEMRGKGFTKEAGEWMVNYVRTRTGKVALTEAEKEAMARRVQEANQPLGKGGIKPKPAVNPKDETPGSLAEDFDEAARRRVLG